MGQGSTEEAAEGARAESVARGGARGAPRTSPLTAGDETAVDPDPRAVLSLRPAARLLSSSSAQIPLARNARFLATESTNPSAPASPRNSHAAQSRPRTRTLRQVGEESGSTAQLVALAVKKTQAKRDEHRGAGGFAGRGSAGGAGPKQPRPPQRTPEEHREWLQQRRAAGGASGQGTAPREGGGEKRRFAGPRGEGAGAGAGAPRYPRGDRASGEGGKPRSGAAFQRPQSQRRSPRPSAAGPQWSAEATRPLTPPSTVRYPSANLAQLLRADLASKAVQLKCVLGGDRVVNEDAETREERQQAKNVLGGDYSLWLEAGKAGKGKEAVVEHARGVLKTNPSVPLTQRQVLLNKIREAVL